MAEARVERRLAAIMAGDIVGYSRLMGIDEEGTLRQLKAHRKELIDPKITEHRGRVVKTTGDGMLVEFVSVVDAVRYAVDVQRGMAERNTNVAPESEMLTELGASSKVNAEWEFFSLLRDEGRKSAQVFLETHASDLGRRSTLDIDVLLGRDLTNGTVAPATDLASRHVHAA